MDLSPQLGIGFIFLRCFVLQILIIFRKLQQSLFSPMILNCESGGGSSNTLKFISTHNWPIVSVKIGARGRLTMPLRRYSLQFTRYSSVFCILHYLTNWIHIKPTNLSNPNIFRQILKLFRDFQWSIRTHRG